MSVFMISLLLGLLLYQILLVIRPRADGSVEVGKNIKIKAELPTNLYLMIKMTLFTVLILIFLGIVVLVVAQRVHPTEGFAYRFADALTSPRMGAAVFGGLVGILLGNVLNRVLKSGDDYKFKASDYLEIGLIAVLVILGIGGEEVLRSYANRINKISVGATTEISFAENAPKTSRATAEQPKGAFRNTQGDSGGSTGLQKLFDIGSKNKPNISRDKEFATTLARYEGEQLRAIADVGTLPGALLSPVASCLSGIAYLYGDATFIEQQLGAMSDPLRKIALREIPDPGPKRTAALDDIRGKLSKVLSDTVRYAPQALKKRDKSVEDRNSCADAADADARGDAIDNAAIETLFNSGSTLPYAAMAYGAIMAALHHYESASITMDSWISAAEQRLADDTATTNAERWYLLRARLTQSLFIEEWIRQRGNSTSSWLRKYHIDNLKQIADRMGAYKAMSGIRQKNGGYSWNVIGPGLGVLQSGDEGPCDIPPLPKSKTAPEEPVTLDDEGRLKTLYSTYLSARKDWVDHSLKHPIAKVKAASIIESEIKNLMTLSLKCIPSGRELTRAEHIDRYVRSELNLMERASSLKSTDEIRGHIRDAQQLLALASQLIDTEATTIKNGKDGGTIQKRISTELVLEVEETLLATQDQVRSYSERDVID
ncbi:hypothetical protein ABIF97_001383 [Bradyrhizobium japonicum]